MSLVLTLFCPFFSCYVLSLVYLQYGEISKVKKKWGGIKIVLKFPVYEKLSGEGLNVNVPLSICKILARL